jgi:hypothetical protein
LIQQIGEMMRREAFGDGVCALSAIRLRIGFPGCSTSRDFEGDLVGREGIEPPTR